MEKKVKFKIKGHGSFYIREGWLRKGIKNIDKNQGVFGEKNVVDILGVGSNMGNAIRYWLQATGLTEEKIKVKGKRIQELTEFGKLVKKNDPYFEDIFTLWLIHYNLVKNIQLSTSWSLFFNKFIIDQFTKEEMNYGLKIALDDYTKNAFYSEKSLIDDCNCIIKTYLNEDKLQLNPEDKTVCPLTELELIGKGQARGKDIYYKKKARRDKLDKLVVLYVIVDNFDSDKGISIEKILNEEGNAGKVFNLHRNILNDYLDELKNYGYIEIKRALGLDMVYLSNAYKNKLTKELIINEYYSR